MKRSTFCGRRPRGGAASGCEWQPPRRTVRGSHSSSNPPTAQVAVSPGSLVLCAQPERPCVRRAALEFELYAPFSFLAVILVRRGPLLPAPLMPRLLLSLKRTTLLFDASVCACALPSTPLMAARLVVRFVAFPLLTRGVRLL